MAACCREIDHIILNAPPAKATGFGVDAFRPSGRRARRASRIGSGTADQNAVSKWETRYRRPGRAPQADQTATLSACPSLERASRNDNHRRAGGSVGEGGRNDARDVKLGGCWTTGGLLWASRCPQTATRAVHRRCHRVFQTGNRSEVNGRSSPAIRLGTRWRPATWRASAGAFGRKPGLRPAPATGRPVAVRGGLARGVRRVLRRLRERF